MKKILIINNSIKPCGIQQWAERIPKILRTSKKFNFIYRMVIRESDIISEISAIKPDVVLYNYSPSTLPYLTKETLEQFKSIKHVAIIHEGYSIEKNAIGFNYFIYMISKANISSEMASRVFIVPIRYLLEYSGGYPKNTVPTIGSFGFGFPSKRFDYIVEKINEEFDVADIKFAISNSFHGDVNGFVTDATIELCRTKITKPRISLQVNRDFLTDNQVLEFLAGNDINCFFYDASKTDGIAGSTDFALSVKRPIAVTKVPMFEHLYSLVPSICIENSSIKEIMGRGIDPLKPIYDAFSNDNFVKSFENILEEIT